MKRLKKRKKLKPNYVELFRLQKKYFRFTDFIDWCETGEGIKWIIKNSKKKH